MTAYTPKNRDTTIIYLNDSGKGFTPNPKFNQNFASRSQHCILLLDYNNDSYPDIIYVEDSISFWKNNADSSFSFVSAYDILDLNSMDTRIGAYNITAADYNNDGKTDLIIGNMLYKNNGNSTFSKVLQIDGVNFLLPFNLDNKDTIDLIGIKKDYVDNINYVWLYRIRGDTVSMSSKTEHKQ